ncbi:hypothetical protein QJS10_CPB04g00549 [Acorus calamus]|uniref:UV radiation resistance-associated gene protein n=1 Tax=Acorus calamus TaxID=4465 RepID=A0AAV9F2I5_ACOCL|nr:hypothetical protein QJS10_CPB04g00549 [Acorus calamus]
MHSSTDLDIDAGDEADDVKVVEWVDVRKELDRLCGLSSALVEAKRRKDLLSQKLLSLIQERKESLRWSNELEEMKERLEARKLVMDDLLMQSIRASEDARSQREQLCVVIRPLLSAAETLSASHVKLEEDNKLLYGEGGHGHLKILRQMLRTRQRHMIAQVAAIFPVEGSFEQAPEVSMDTKYGGSRSGLRVTVPPLKMMTLFYDTKELQRSAGALGYVAHAVLLIASYLHVPLRYPLLLGGSRSYIHDYAPSIELSPSDLTSNSVNGLSSKLTDFPLFLEGHDTTRAVYAIFLLNKDLEQLLDYMGIQSLGPHHVLANLRELLRIIQSEKFIDK